MLIVFLFISYISFSTFGEIPPFSQSWQLQQLINKSEEQIRTLQALLKYEKQNALLSEKAIKILTNLTAGIDQSLEPFRGTEAFQKALLDLQQKDGYQRTYTDRNELNTPGDNSNDMEEFVRFQMNSVRANQADTVNQMAVDRKLSKAPPGMVPKIHSHSQLAEWQATTRISTQLTEILSLLHAIKEELRQQRKQPSSVNLLVKGADYQNELQRGRR